MATVAPTATRVDDLHILDTGYELETDAHGRALDQVRWLWFHNVEWEAGQRYEVYRVVRLYLLRAIPQEARADPTFLDQMRTVWAGLYSQRTAQYDLVQLLAGMWDPEPLGVAQIYGVVGLGSDLAAAQRQAHLGATALRNALAGAFPQIKLALLTVAQLNWLVDAYGRLRHAAVVIGQPDERLAAKGHGREGPGEAVSPLPAELGVTGQQLEIMLRALAKGQHTFLASLIASPVGATTLTRLLTGLADEASVTASLQTGLQNIGVSLALPVSLSANLGWATGSAFGRSATESVGHSAGVTTGRAHTVGYAHTTGHTVSDGVTDATGVANSSGTSITTTTAVSDGTSHTDGTAHTEGTAHSVGSAHTSGSFSSSSSSAGYSGGTTVSHAVTDGVSQGVSQGVSTGISAGSADTASSGVAVSDGTNWGHQDGGAQSVSGNLGASVTQSGGASLGGGVLPVGVSGDRGVGFNAGVGYSTSENWSDSTGGSASMTTSAGSGHTASTGVSLGTSQTASTAASHGVSTGITQSSGWSFSSGSSSGSSSSDTTSVSDTTSQSDSTSHSDGTSHGVSTATAIGSFSSTTTSSSHAVSHTESSSVADTRSTADSTSTGTSRGVTTGQSTGVTVGRSQGQTQGFGLGLGSVAGLSYGEGHQLYDDQAIQLTAVLRAQEELLRQATLDGGYQTDFYLLTATEAGLATAEVAVRQAFQGGGQLVVTPVQTRRLSPAEQEYIRLHALAFTPSTRPEKKKSTYEAYRDSTLLLPRQLAAYSAPALFEQGLCATNVEQIPAFSFRPDLRGPVVLGHQISTELGEVTDVPLRLSRNKLFHTAFCADTGYGKSVAAERLILESTLAWHTRTIVLDFGAGWRKMINAPGLADRVVVYQLQPGAVVPFRWNPFQVGRRIAPDQQMLATCEILQAAGRMGERQYGYLLQAVEQLWTEAGVLVDSEAVRNDPVWGVVQPAEWPAVTAAQQEYGLPARAPTAGPPLSALSPWERQAIAVARSKVAGFPRLLQLLEEMLHGREVPVYNQAGQVVKRRREGGFKPGSTEASSLEGLLLRLRVFRLGELARQYAPGPDCIALEDLGLLGPAGDQWGVAILEGGAAMPEYAKAALLGLIAWQLYQNSVAYRQERINLGLPPQTTLLVLEEANKILTGVSTGSSSDDNKNSANVCTQFQNMFRDGRKYEFFLLLIIQSASELPAGLLSSCNNLVVGQSKNPKDRDVLQAQLGFSEKGFVDEDYKRYITRQPIARVIVRLGYVTEPEDVMPFAIQPVQIECREPTDQELWVYHQHLCQTGIIH